MYSYTTNDDGYTIDLDVDSLNTLHLGYNVDDISYEPFSELPADNYAFIFTSGGLIYSWVSYQETPGYGYVDSLFSDQTIGTPEYIDLVDTSAFWLSNEDDNTYLYKGNVGTKFGNFLINGPNKTVSVLFGTSDTAIWASFNGTIQAFKYIVTLDSFFVFYATADGVFAGDLAEHQNPEITQLNITVANVSDIEVYQNLLFVADNSNSVAVVYDTFTGVSTTIDVEVNGPLDILLGSTFGTIVQAKAAAISNEKSTSSGSTGSSGILGAAVNMIAVTVATMLYALL